MMQRLCSGHLFVSVSVRLGAHEFGVDAVQAGAHGVSTADVVLRWLRQRGIVAIPKSPQPPILLHLSNPWRLTFWVWWQA